jgi:dTDP-4-dehydrorhamnose 3,5-epimerase
MEALRLAIPDVVLLTPKVAGDERGFVFESFRQVDFEKATGLARQFVQDSHANSKKGVLRGMYYQLRPWVQGRLVRVVQGEIFNVAVDIRRSSATFGSWVGVQLSAQNMQQLWVPEGFANGFVTLSDTSDVLFKATDLSSREQERCIAWDDPTVGINWHYEGAPGLSEGDRAGLALSYAEVLE